ncbi:RNA polymerase factor sigma-54 [Thermodesulfobacteriota bacterium]
MMFIGLQQKQIQTQTLIMTPQLQMAIKLLQLSRMELAEKVKQELKENPALEDLGESGYETDTNDQDRIIDGIDRQIQLDSRSYQVVAARETEYKEIIDFEKFTATETSLSEHLLWQLLMTSPTREEKKIGSVIASNLDEDGYLKISADQIAEMATTTPARAEQALSVMQTFDPSGVCARDLKECLLLQVRNCGVEDDRITTIIYDHLHLLERNNYNAVCRAMKMSIKDIGPLIDVIKNLEPKPGRPFGGKVSQYIEPDVFVYRQDGEFVITLNNDGMPRLWINPLYRKYVTAKDKISTEALDYMREKIGSAAWLIKSIHQRQRTLYRVMESILKFQQDFFENGTSHLKPMVLRSVADDIDMSESTVSRITTNKYVQTVHGIFELKYFFSSFIQCSGSEPMSSTVVQEKIKKIIAHENPVKPLSDDKIAKILNGLNINIARRTVAKYREKLKILPSSRRRQF